MTNRQLVLAMGWVYRKTEHPTVRIGQWYRGRKLIWDRTKPPDFCRSLDGLVREIKARRLDWYVEGLCHGGLAKANVCGYVGLAKTPAMALAEAFYSYLQR